MPARSLVALLSLLIVLAAATTQRAEAATDVRVMTFNVWLGGDVVDFGKVIETIRASGADIVGLQEPEGNTRRIAEALGWPYWSDRLHVVSRYPLIDPPEARGEYVLAQTRPGEVFALANVHLTSDPYGPYAVRDGRPLARVLALERSTRLPEIRAVLRALRPATRRAIPTLMTGDFNSPSHLDWTPAVDAIRPDVRYPVAWPVTRALADAGFQDTYRVAHPDPVATPGITWTFGYPFPRLAQDEVVDRIDLVQASAGVDVRSSGIAGPPLTRDVTVPIDPYPSDHRAVVSTVRLTPASPAPFASVLQRRVQSGDAIGVRYAAPRGESTDRLAIVPAGGRPEDAIMTLPPQEASFFGRVTFGSGGLRAGRYDALLITARNRVLSRSTFWVVDRGARPRLRVTTGDDVRVAWRNAPGYRRDWIGIYRQGAPTSTTTTSRSSTRARPLPGSTTIADRLPPGRYVVRLMKDDGYAQLARAAFRVRR